jgi:hypothetical protein
MAHEIEINLEKTIRDIKLQIGSVNSDIVGKAVAAAINRATVSARAVAVKEIKHNYNIDPKFLKEKTGTKENRYNAIKVWRANRNSLTGKIIAYGRPIPISAFPYSQSGDGISVSIRKGQTKTFPGAFEATMKSGHKAVFGRAKYLKGVYTQRHQRVKRFPNNDLPITQIMTTSLRAAIMEPQVALLMSNKAQTVFANRFKHELLRLMK